MTRTFKISLSVWLLSILVFIGFVFLMDNLRNAQPLFSTWPYKSIPFLLLSDVLIGVTAFISLCSELIHHIFSTKKRAQNLTSQKQDLGKSEKKNFLENITLARFLQRVFLAIVLAFIFGLVSLPFMKSAEGFSFEERAKIGSLNIWREVFVFGVLTGIFSLYAFSKKHYRISSSVLIFFWLFSDLLPQH